MLSLSPGTDVPESQVSTNTLHDRLMFITSISHGLVNPTRAWNWCLVHKTWSGCWLAAQGHVEPGRNMLATATEMTAFGGIGR